jgi:hypothetical protein
MPTAIPAEAILKRGAPLSDWIRFGLIQVRAKKPSTTLGIAASSSRSGLRKPRARRPAYSER